MTTPVISGLLMVLFLLNQVLSGLSFGGTLLCISGVEGVRLQAVGATCCAVPSHHVLMSDPCCPSDRISPQCSGVIDEVSAPQHCQGCMDVLLTSQPALPCVQPVALPPTPGVVIAVIPWPLTCDDSVTTSGSIYQAPPPLAFLANIVLRC